jgi:hypothetical protein
MIWFKALAEEAKMQWLSYSLSSSSSSSSMGLEWNQLHYYCGHLLAYCTSPQWHMAMTVEQLVEWMSSWRNWSTQRKPAPMLLCSPQIPHDLTQARTRATAIGSWRLTAWVMTWPMTWLTSALKRDVWSSKTLEISTKLHNDTYLQTAVLKHWMYVQMFCHVAHS